MDAASEQSPRRPTRGSRRTWWSWGAGLLLIAVTFDLYANVLHAPFVLDDISTVQNNLSIRRLWPLDAPTEPVMSSMLKFCWLILLDIPMRDILLVPLKKLILPPAW